MLLCTISVLEKDAGFKGCTYTVKPVENFRYNNLENALKWCDFVHVCEYMSVKEGFDTQILTI